MTALRKRTNRITAAGIIFTLAAGTLLHFVYEWTGNNIAAALISAVNESIWEHIKLLYVPVILFIITGSFTFAKKIKTFIPAMTLGLYAGAAFIPTAYYTYSGILGMRHIAADISIFIISVLITFFTARHRILKQEPASQKGTIVSIAMLALITAAIVYFTFDPPHIPLFKDYVTGDYGIPFNG